MQLINYSAAKACACGDNRVMELHNLKNELQKLQILEKSYKDKKINLMNDIKSYERKINTRKEKLECMKLDLNEINELPSSEVDTITLGGKVYDKESVDEAVEALGVLTKSTKSGIIGYIKDKPIRLKLVETTFNKLEKIVEIGNHYKLNMGYKAYPKLMYNEIIDYVNKLKIAINSYEKNIEILTNELNLSKEGLNKPFTGAKELNELKIKVANLENELSLESEIA